MSTYILRKGVSPPTDLKDVTATAAEINDVADKSAQSAVAITADTTLDQEAHAGKVIVFGSADGDTVTLPAATGSGSIYEVVVGTAPTSNAHILQVANATDVMAGQAIGADGDGGGATGYTWPTASTTDTVTLDGTATGGAVGDVVVVRDIASGVFQVTAILTQSGGSEATPFSAAVS